MNTLRRSIAANYAQSFATAIRNIVDPEDSATEHYLNQLAVRLKAALDYADKNGVTRAEVCRYIADSVEQELGWIESGALADLRDSIRSR